MNVSTKRNFCFQTCSSEVFGLKLGGSIFSLISSRKANSSHERARKKLKLSQHFAFCANNCATFVGKPTRGEWNSHFWRTWTTSIVNELETKLLTSIFLPTKALNIVMKLAWRFIFAFAFISSNEAFSWMIRIRHERWKSSQCSFSLQGESERERERKNCFVAETFPHSDNFERETKGMRELQCSSWVFYDVVSF